jgi:coproporphyrinogen III oxidase-like Fe-S oxidoreductase
VSCRNAVIVCNCIDARQSRHIPSMEPLSLYIHWPFCLSKCPYCDFNSHVRENIPQSRFRAALRRELAWEAARLGRRRLTSIFFGGGTPSLMEPDTVADLIADATRLFDPADDLEITLEANPTSVEASRFAAYRTAGVNRASIGIQSLDPDALHMLGRQHSAAQAITALETARATFPRISFDLIYARPGQTLEAWRSELRQALAIAADHLSLYQLTIEPGTQFATLHQRLLPYEVSNYAKPGSESRHNLTYWRYSDYAGIGPGAHGRLTLPASFAGEPIGHDDNRSIVATRRHRAPEVWAERVERDGHGMVQESPLGQLERAREMLLMGLRLTEGIDAAHFADRTGVSLGGAIDQGVLQQALGENYLAWQGNRLVALPAGRLRLDALLAALVR